MKRAEQHPVDEYLRRALQPQPEVVTRVTRQALRSPTATRRLTWKLALVPALLVVVAVCAWLWQPTGPPPGPKTVVVVRAPSPAYTISNCGGVVAATTANGQVMAIISGGSS